LQGLAAAQGFAAASCKRGSTQLVAPPAAAAHGLQGLHGLAAAAAQGLHGLAAAQGLHGFAAAAAQGLHGLAAAQGLHGFAAAAAQGLHGLVAAHGLHGLLAMVRRPWGIASGRPLVTGTALAGRTEQIARPPRPAIPIASTMGSTVVDFNCARVARGLHGIPDRFITCLPLINIGFARTMSLRSFGHHSPNAPNDMTAGQIDSHSWQSFCQVPLLHRGVTL
jgi:hypothetical protein